MGGAGRSWLPPEELNPDHCSIIILGSGISEVPTSLGGLLCLINDSLHLST